MPTHEEDRGATAMIGDNSAHPVDFIDALEKIDAIGQAPLGAIFEAGTDTLIVTPISTDSDFKTAKSAIVRQLHDEIIRKVIRFREVAVRLDNYIGWSGIANLSNRVFSLINRRTEDIPDVLGYLYSGALELGSYLEMDRRTYTGEISYVLPLDAEMLRPLEDLLISFAPWLRSFPTVRHLDDESGKFLVEHHSLVQPSTQAVRTAEAANLISLNDAAAILGLLDASGRGEFQGGKAGQRAVASVRNMVIKTASLIGAFLLGAIGSDFATKSTLTQAAGTFLGTAEDSILQVVRGLPQDLRLAVEVMIKRSRDAPPLAPSEQTPQAPARRRSEDD